MKTHGRGKWLMKALLLGSTATFVLALASVDVTTFDVSMAQAAGGQGHGKGGGSDSRGGGGGGGGGSSDRGESRGSQYQGGKADTAAPTLAEPESPAIVAPKSASGGKAAAPAKRAGKPVVVQAEDEDSDRPDWAGIPGGKDGAGGGSPDMAGSTKGDLYGDLFVILRDDQGIPLLTPEGWVQPIDIDGNLIPLDEEGAPIDETLTQEVEIGRLNVGRAPVSVLENRTTEVLAVLSAAEDITTDAAGRLVLTIDGVAKTIDSPLENLAIYVDLMTAGSIGDLTPDDLFGTEFDFLVDGIYDDRDLAASTAFLAAATDKSGEFSIDEIAYIDAFLDINTEKDGSVTYSVVDYTTFNYDREDTFKDVYAEVLVFEDGVWVPKTVNVWEEVFGEEVLVSSGTLEAYTAAAEDARMVIEFIHEYALPAEDLG